MSRWKVAWIKDSFDNLCFRFPDRTEWEICKKICEKSYLFSAKQYEAEHSYAESQAVYNCRQIDGPSVGKEAIMKIRLQVPSREDMDMEEIVNRAIPLPGDLSMAEISTLTDLNRVGCSVAPQILTWLHATQAPYMLVPGGYVVMLVMEKFPGKTLVDFWSRPFEERRNIRAAFRIAAEELFGHNVYHGDKHLGNIMYDPEHDKCYIIDYEDVDLYPDEDDFWEWSDNEYFYWGLSRYGKDGDVY